MDGGLPPLVSTSCSVLWWEFAFTSTLQVSDVQFLLAYILVLVYGRFLHEVNQFVAVKGRPYWFGSPSTPTSRQHEREDGLDENDLNHSRSKLVATRSSSDRVNNSHKSTLLQQLILLLGKWETVHGNDSVMYLADGGCLSPNSYLPSASEQ